MKNTGKTKTRKPETPAFDAEGYQTNLRHLNGAALPDLSKVEAAPFGWGGARAGAGRKPSGRQPVLLRLTPSTIRSLRRGARQAGCSLSEYAEGRLLAVAEER